MKALAGRFASAGTPAYLVGGAVRDLLLSREPTDLHVAVASDTRPAAEDVANALGGRAFPLDEDRGMFRVTLSSVDGGTSIDLSPMAGGIHEYLGGTGFTLDAMAVSLPDLHLGRDPVKVIDPYNGAQDLRDRVIRALSPEVFEEDPGLLMRAPGLATELGFAVEVETAEWVRRHAGLLNAVAPERLRDELLKLLAHPGSAQSLRMLDDLGLLCELMPELAEARGVTQPKEHHWDVFEHCIETAGQVERLLPTPAVRPVQRFDSMEEYFAEPVSDGHERVTFVKLAGLLHDIAKPATKTVEPSGRMRFLGHQYAGARMADTIAERLRLSPRGRELIKAIVEHHLRPSQMAQDGEMPTPRAINRYYRDVGEAAIDTLYLNLADYLAAKGPDLAEREWEEHCQVMGHILREVDAQSSPEAPPGLVDGHDIMKTFSLAPGPRVGTLLEVVHQAQATGEINSRQEAVRLIESALETGDGIA